MCESVALVRRSGRRSEKRPAGAKLGIDAIELGRVEQGIVYGFSIAAALGAYEEVTLPAQGQTADRTFRTIIVDLQEAVFQIPQHSIYAVQGVADGFGQSGFAEVRVSCTASQISRFSKTGLAWR